MEQLVDIRDVSKVFVEHAAPALDHVSYMIPKGQMVGLAGPDGAGKTTLIRLIAGLLLPTTGDITIAGLDTRRDQSEITHLISYMPQKFGLYEDLTVSQNLNLYADLKGVVGHERQQVFEKLLKFTGLSPFQDRFAGALSGGMKQKLGLACSLIKKPLLLLLDEPSVGVDPLSRKELWKMVQDLLGEGISVVWSTAYLDEAERCDTVLLLNEGKLLYKGSPEELTESLKNRTFKITQIRDNRRKLLTQVLRMPDVIDGVVQGKDVRLVMKKEAQVSTVIDQLKQQEPDIEFESTPSRFEDAFVDILGGGPSEESPLMQTFRLTNGDEKITIEAQGLTKKFGNFIAADHVSFKIRSGEIFGLLGPNGAGKSTTFKMLCGLLKPTSGEAFVNGVDLLRAPGEARSHIGYMAQKFSLYGNLSVWQNLNFFSGIYQLKGKVKEEAMQRMIEIFNFKDYLNASADTLPLGYKQRLALACAVMHNPAVLFLDEPTSGVDPITRREFWNHINGMVEKKVTVMVTTHFMDEAEYCDRIALIYKSKIIKVGTPDSLKEEARSNELLNPSLEDAFIRLIEQYDREHPDADTRN